jgi:C1A family cysteine protease
MVGTRHAWAENWGRQGYFWASGWVLRVGRGLAQQDGEFDVTRCTVGLPWLLPSGPATRGSGRISHSSQHHEKAEGVCA